MGAERGSRLGLGLGLALKERPGPIYLSTPLPGLATEGARAEEARLRGGDDLV